MTRTETLADIAFQPVEHGTYTIMIPPEVDTSPPPPTKSTDMRHQEPVSPRAFGEALARKRKGRKE